jgi:tRNA (guanine37-N1)-methyltransferase
MTINITQGLQVKPEEVEKIRKYLYENKLLNEDYKIKREKEYVYLPIKNLAKKELNSYKVVKKEFEKKKTPSKSYKELLSIPTNLKEILPTSYDIIGNIILIKLPEKLLDYQKDIGKALLKTHKNVNTVCLSKPVTGELRIRNIKIIAGKKCTNTVHKEYGLQFFVDINKTYFSPRLANERKRLAKLVQPGETVVDMFAGVAPFSIMIAKYASPKIVYAIDKNKDAVTYAKQNIKHNKVVDKVEVCHADAKNIEKIFKKKNVKADRIIMNLPFSAYMFFPYALKIANEKCNIHYYDIIKEDSINNLIIKLNSDARENRVALTNLEVKKIKTYAPREFYIGINITAKKGNIK